MSAPFFELGAFAETGSLVVAMFIGIAFGWVLEQSGMGSARKLAGQFYLRDLTVFKVMFTAIVTAMLGVFWLGWLGVVDVSRIYVPETFILPQLVGGLIFGAGFAIAGLCPGTSCVSAATGRADGLAVVGGSVMGIGAVFARGCTSGQALTGGALLSVGSWLFMGAAFAAGYAVAPLVRRAWT